MIDAGATVTRLLLCALLLATGPAALGQDLDTAAAGTIRHPHGFTVALPYGWAGGTTDDAIWMHRPDRRYPRSTTLRLQDGATDLPRTNLLDGDRLGWDVVALNGGSGGTEYRFVAERPLCGATLRLEQVAQQEYVVPDFSIAWAILASAACKPN